MSPPLYRSSHQNPASREEHALTYKDDLLLLRALRESNLRFSLAKTTRYHYNTSPHCLARTRTCAKRLKTSCANRYTIDPYAPEGLEPPRSCMVSPIQVIYQLNYGAKNPRYLTTFTGETVVGLILDTIYG